MTKRNEILKELGGDSPPWDVLVIGGGATGLGAAVEAASRGYRTLLVERSDFAKETSSRSTKLVHGGVRYLQQMNVTLVLDALRERGHMLRNAPHLVHDLNFVIPAYSYFSLPYYGIGLKVYERLSGKLSFGHSEVLSRKTALEKLPGVKSEGLRGGILYHDGQFDDARYAIALLRTLQDLGGVAINYVEATGLIERDGKVIGIRARDQEDGADFELQAKAVVNATGVHVEQIIDMDGKPHKSSARRQPGIAFRLAAQLPARQYRVDDSQDRRWARPLCHSVAWRVDRRHHGCAGRLLIARAARSARGEGLSSRPYRQVSRPRAAPGRDPQRFFGAAAPGPQRSCQNLQALARSHHSGFAFRPRSRSQAASGPPIAAWARTPSIAPSQVAALA